MADKTRYACAKEALERYGAELSQEQLLRAYEAGGVLPMEMRRNLRYGFLPENAAFDLKEKNAPGVLDNAPLWASVCPEDAKRAMQLAHADASIDGDMLTVENARYLTAAFALRYAGAGVRDSLAQAAELIAEEGKTARLVVDAHDLTAKDAAHAAQRMAWRYDSDKETAMSRLSKLVTALLLEEDNGDELYAAFYREKAEIHYEQNVQEQPLRRMSVSLMGPPCLQPGKARACLLKIENDSKMKMLSAIRCSAEGTVKAMTAPFSTVEAGQTVTIPYTVWLPEETETISERNVLTADYAGIHLRFGIAGAQGWRVRGRQSGEWGAWEAFFSEGNHIALDSLSGRQGPCEFEMERVLVVREALEETLRVTHTCGFVLEMDGERILEGEATDGWSRSAVQKEIKLEKGEHTLRIMLRRAMPGGMIRIDHIRDGELLAMEAVNPMKGL